MTEKILLAHYAPCLVFIRHTCFVDSQNFLFMFICYLIPFWFSVNSYVGAISRKGLKLMKIQLNVQK